jgi:pimeloyl-ACP methyl ester carboxylesterase
MVFVNPGGPGSSAIDFLISTASFLSTTVGTNYDLVAYEPRGIGYSQPLANCSTTVPVQQPRKRLFNLPYGPRLPSKFYEDEYAYQQGLGSSCAAAIGGVNQIGQHMSTAIVVKDAISVLDAYALSSYSNGVSNPKDFNFWGFSYGTVIGQTFAMMYPNRVGRFVLDGIVDAEDYYAGQGLKNVHLADRAFSTFFAYCNKAGPNVCTYYTGSTSRDIYERFQRTVLKLDAKKAYQENWSNKTAVLLGLQGLKLLANVATVDPINYFPFLPQVFEFPYH